MVRYGKVYMFYAGAYNNCPQQIGVAVSRDGIHFERLSDSPFYPTADREHGMRVNRDIPMCLWMRMTAYIFFIREIMTEAVPGTCPRWK